MAIRCLTPYKKIQIVWLTKGYTKIKYLTVNLNSYIIIFVKAALKLFETVPVSTTPGDPVQFTNYGLHDTFTPHIYSLEGNDVKPRGPIRVTEVRVRRRIRFVRVDFFEWVTNTLGQMVPVKYMSSYAWQGEHSIHLLEQPNVYDLDPFGEDDNGSAPTDMDRQHAKLLTLQGERDIHLDLF